MAHRNERSRQQDEWRQSDRNQMGQYADPQRQYGSHDDTRDWGRPRNGDDLHRHDPAQASYGRAGAPDVRGAPSGGYQRDWQADPGYNRPGYTRYEGYQGHGGRDGRHTGGYGQDGMREEPAYRYQHDRQGGYDAGRGWGGAYAGDGEHERQARYQGGAGGYRSNAGPYAGSQTYGGYGDQLGYGSYEDGRQHHHDPDYQQWREQQLRNLDQDYHSWRGERYKKFSEEFDTWRKNRQGTSEQQADRPGAQADPGKNTGTK